MDIGKCAYCRASLPAIQSSETFCSKCSPETFCSKCSPLLDRLPVQARNIITHVAANIGYYLEKQARREAVLNEERRKEMLEDSRRERNLEGKLNFLRLPLVDEHANGGLRGDVIILVRGNADELVHAHKFILASKSRVFLKMFENEMLEHERGMVLIDDATLPVVRAMVKYCYDAEIEFTEEVTPEEVLEIAHKYSIDALQNLCEVKLGITLNEFNLPKRLKLSTKFEARGLQTAAYQYFKENFDSVISSVVEELCVPACVCNSEQQ